MGEGGFFFHKKNPPPPCPPLFVVGVAKCAISADRLGSILKRGKK